MLTFREFRILAALVRVLVQVGVAVAAVTLIGLVWWTRGW